MSDMEGTDSCRYETEGSCTFGKWIGDLKPCVQVANEFGQDDALTLVASAFGTGASDAASDVTIGNVADRVAAAWQAPLTRKARGAGDEIEESKQAPLRPSPFRFSCARPRTPHALDDPAIYIDVSFTTAY